jgi:hypothetical protein
MEGGAAKQFGLLLLLWIAYFFIIYSVCTYLYFKMRGEPPKEENRLVFIEGRTVPAKLVWQERDQRLRKRFLRLAMILMFVPLLLPFILRIIG